MEATDSLVSRVHKHIEGLKTKNGKLAEENARLKAALAEAKTSNSRIRRIPKKRAPAAADDDAAAAAQPAETSA